MKFYMKNTKRNVNAILEYKNDKYYLKKGSIVSKDISQALRSNRQVVKRREGNIDNNYTQFKETAVIKALDSIEKDKSTSYLFTFPSLLKLNTQKSYAFSDRLIEYLVHNVITGQDELSGNVIAVNNRFGIFNNQNVPEPEWSKTTQLRVFLDMVNKNIDDINGYIDKDTEESLGW